MKGKQRLVVLVGVLMMAGFLGKTVAAETEYSDPAKQARWETAQGKRAQDTEARRSRFRRWIDGSLKKLKPNPNAHRGSDTTAGTMSHVNMGGETK